VSIDVEKPDPSVIVKGVDYIDIPALGKKFTEHPQKLTIIHLQLSDNTS
jgi:hypothetical protein